MGIAFFDLDRTIVSCNTATLWTRREVRLGHMSRWQALRAAWWIGLYHLGAAAMEDAIERAVATLAGVREDSIRTRSLALWQEEVVALVRPGARTAVARHRARGDRLVLLTTSSNYLSEPVTAELGLDEYVCNRFEVVDGVFTGVPVRPLCFGAGKLRYAREVAARAAVELSACAFYTDSFSDLPLLAAVGEPVAVHPDPRLAREARRRGWRTELWD